MKTTNVDNTGIASIAVTIEDEKGLQVIGAKIIAESNIEEFPLPFPTEAKSHTCEFDEGEKVARRKYDGKIVNADFSIMKQERNKRVEQFRKIETISEEELAKKGYSIDDNGEIVKTASGMEIGD